MRAIDITVFLIAIQLALGFVSALGIFETNYYEATSNEYSKYTINDLGNYTDKEDIVSQGINTVKMSADFLWEGAFFMIKILGTVVVVYPTLVTIFNIPAVLSAMLQGMVYFMYFLGYYQWKTGKSVGNFV